MYTVSGHGFLELDAMYDSTSGKRCAHVDVVWDSRCGHMDMGSGSSSKCREYVYTACIVAPPMM